MDVRDPKGLSACVAVGIGDGNAGHWSGDRDQRAAFGVGFRVATFGTSDCVTGYGIRACSSDRDADRISFGVQCCDRNNILPATTCSVDVVEAELDVFNFVRHASARRRAKRYVSRCRATQP